MPTRTPAAVLAAVSMMIAAPAAAQDVKPLPKAAPPAAASPAIATKPAPARQAAPAADPFAAIPPARPADVASIDAIVAALYDVISGDKGVERDWNRFRSLFYPGARMIPTGKSERTGKINARVVSPDTYIKSSESFLEGEGFHEQELARRVDSFGNIAQVFSSYEARHAVSEPKPFLRGINSIQLFNDGNRWWVMSMAWSPETAEHPLPKAYSEKQQR
jgi:hypothetical protein